MEGYPVVLRLNARRVLVAGAGRVATRRVRGLLQAGADVTVVAPAASDQMSAWAAAGRLRHEARTVREQDVQGAVLVVAATDEPRTNAQLATWADAAGALINRADDGTLGDVQVPAHVAGGHISVALWSGGQAPAAVRRLGSELEAWLQRGPERFAAELSRLRASGTDAGTLRALSDGPLLQACIDGDETRIAQLISGATA